MMENGMVQKRNMDNKGWEIGEDVQQKLLRHPTLERTLGWSEVLQFHPH